MLNMWAAHYDPKYWDEPTKFNPGKNTDKDRYTIKKRAPYSPTATGSNKNLQGFKSFKGGSHCS